MRPMKLLFAGAFTALIVLPTPAWAIFCSAEGYVPKTFVEQDGRSVLRTDVELLNQMDTKRLREIGVQARSVERWNGCMRAFVTTPDGRNIMEFYDPLTLKKLR